MPSKAPILAACSRSMTVNQFFATEGLQITGYLLD